MKLTRQRLKEIIKEELLNEGRPFREWQDHRQNLNKLFRGAHWAVKAIPHKKKEAREIQKLSMKLADLTEIITAEVIDM